MAKKTDEKSGAIEYRKFGEDCQFVLNNLDERDKAKLDEMPLDSDVLYQMSDKALELGFVITKKWDSHSKCWQASVVCNAKNVLNTGLAVSGRSHLGGADAEFVALYKLFYVAQGDLTPHKTENSAQKRRG